MAPAAVSKLAFQPAHWLKGFGLKTEADAAVPYKEAAQEAVHKSHQHYYPLSHRSSSLTAGSAEAAWPNLPGRARAENEMK